MQSSGVAILGVDVGGTFTDAVLVDGDVMRTAKVPTADRQEESVLAAARAVGASGVERFAHGTTVATNALLERRGARTAFVSNAGFEHLLHTRRQTRAHLYRLCDDHPAPLVPLERCHGVRGRLGPEAELEPLDLGSLPDVGEAEAVAVCLLFAFRDPSQERVLAAELRRLTSPGAAFPRTMGEVIAGVREMRGQAIVVVGLLLLIATPVMRVAVSIVAFAVERDWVFATITGVVLGLLLLSFFIGKVEG